MKGYVDSAVALRLSHQLCQTRLQRNQVTECLENASTFERFISLDMHSNVTHEASFESSRRELSNEASFVTRIGLRRSKVRHKQIYIAEVVALKLQPRSDALRRRHGSGVR